MNEETSITGPPCSSQAITEFSSDGQVFEDNENI